MLSLYKNVRNVKFVLFTKTSINAINMILSPKIPRRYCLFSQIFKISKVIFLILTDLKNIKSDIFVKVIKSDIFGFLTRYADFYCDRLTYDLLIPSNMKYKWFFPFLITGWVHLIQPIRQGKFHKHHILVGFELTSS